MPPAAQNTAQELLSSGKLVIVPSDIAAQQLRYLHDEKQRSEGTGAWPPALVLTWEQWLRSLWSEAVTNGLEDRLLLNATQEHSLWRDIIQARSSAASETLSSIDSLADLAATAWRLSESYNAASRLHHFAGTHDSRIFAEWADAFARLCNAEGYVSRASLESVLTALVDCGDVHISQPQMFCAGFDRFAPASRQLLEAVQHAGVQVTETQIVADLSSTQARSVLQAKSENAELQAIAEWIRTFLRDRIDVGHTARVGVLIADLEAIESTVNSIFRYVLAPELQSVESNGSQAPFQINQSTPLHAEPSIATALDLARWASGPLSREAVSALLLSPYLATDASADDAARFDANVLRSAKLLRPEVSVDWLAREVFRSGNQLAITWPFSLTKFLEAAEKLDSPRGFAHWTEFIRRLTQAAGWPGTRAQDSHEYAITRAWEHALDSVATLDFSGVRATFQDTLQALERELAHPLSANLSRSPVQVLAPSQAAGLTFDVLIFARVTDTNWPGLPSANPLIPWTLQSMLNMPGADHAMAIADARATTSTLLNSAGSVIFTFAAANTEGSQRLSPLIADLGLPSHSVGETQLDSDLQPLVAPERIEDTASLPSLPSGIIRGGATVLQHQAACGFRAFSEIRLRSQELEAKDLGFDARERGNLLHNVMQRFWKEVKTQRALKAMPAEHRKDLIDCCIDESLDKRALEEGGWSAAYLHLQKQRLTRLLTRWLTLELQRSEFEVVATEVKKPLTVGPLHLELRVDRIDLVEDGELLVDYKTGSGASTADWDGERPNEPQLPLYTLLASENELAGLAFAKIRPGKAMSWQGYAAQSNVIPGRDTSRDLSMLQADWYGHLTSLAHAFAAGDTSVDPKTYPATCSRCSQNLLCRISSADLLDTEDPVDSPEEEPGA